MSSDFTFEQYKVLHEIAEELARPGDLDPALEKTLHFLSAQLGFERGMITVFRRDIDEIRTIVAYNMTEAETGKARYNPGEGITGKVVREGKPIVVPRIDLEPDFLNKSGTRNKNEHSELSFICVPISYSKNIVGTLSADFRAKEKEELNTELNLLTAVASLVASRVERRRIIDENNRLRHLEIGDDQSLILGSSDAMRNLRYLVSQVADSKTSVLLYGETGTGKGLVARALHRLSPRKDQPFVHLNCGAIPENLIESELFGHEKGSFTGATAQREGKFDAAGMGTIFLDEINSLPASSQVKLLRVIQDKEYERVGSNQTIKSNARIIAASNVDLEIEVDSGKFRADLFYRLNVFPIIIPPLRSRGSDILLLADHFVKKFSEEMNKQVERIDTPAIDMLMSYHWPGNVRELENAIERAILLANDAVISSRNLPPSLQIKSAEILGETRGRLEQLVAVYEMGLIKDALKDVNGNQSKAAKLLETTKRIIQYKIKKYNIECDIFKKG